MAKKAFLYTGVTFLLMMTILISANYLFLSKHTASESKNADLEIDVVNNIVGDARAVLITDPNNTVADAISDIVFSSLRSGLNIHTGAYQNTMDPTHTLSESSRTNLTKWFFNYTNLTLSSINRSSILPFNFSYPVLISLGYSASFGGAPPFIPATFFVGRYTYKFFYLINVSGSFPMKLNQTLNFSKTLDIRRPKVDPLYYTYCVNITDDKTSLIDFSKEVYCDVTPCRLRPKTLCP